MANNHSAPTHKIIDVVCLVAMDPDDKILATQRAKDKPLGMLWEFPGGKVDTGESAEGALRREIIEELGIELGALTRLPAVTHAYDFCTIQLIPFLSKVDTRPQLGELHAHAAAQWIALDKWNQLQWAPADLPIIERLLKTELSK
jgi:mutator protein MutT